MESSSIPTKIQPGPEDQGFADTKGGPAGTHRAEEKEALREQRVASEQAAAQPAQQDTKDDDGGSDTSELNKLSPETTEVVRILGRPPQEDGADDQWSKYVQRPLGFMARNRLFALMAGVLKRSVKSGQLDDVIDEVRASGIKGYAGQLQRASTGDFSQFLGIFFSLIEEAPDFIVDVNCILLDIPLVERIWARQVMEQRWDPKNNQYGLSDEVAMDILKVGIAQNYEDIRGFFSELLPKLWSEIRSQEEARTSESAS